MGGEAGGQDRTTQPRLEAAVMGKGRECLRCGKRMILVVTKGDKYWECVDTQCLYRLDVR